MDVIESSVGCPYCGEVISLVIDCSVAEQQYIEDCFVCCRPINVSVKIDSESEPTLEVFAENE